MEERNVADLWAEAKQLIRLETSDVSYDTWIRDLRPIMVMDNRFVVQAPTLLIKNFVIDRYQMLIAGMISKVANRQLGAEVLLPTEVENLLRVRSGGVSAVYAPMLNGKYTFDTFVVGSGNRFAHAASLAAAELPGEAYNPLFLYGGVGLGKTHLMHAIGNYILSQNPGANVLYVTSETFANELIRAISTNKNQEFRNKFRNVDVLMVDDIQFIGGKEQTQEEFFHTFNTLHESGKQIVISSDKQPKEIVSLEDRLRSRFEWGLIADVQKPDLETRIAILRRKADVEELFIPQEVIEMIAAKVESNIRELEGCLTRVSAYATLNGEEVTPTLAETALREMLPNRDPRKISPDSVVAAVCDFYNTSADDITGQKRNREIVLPRQIAMYLLRNVVDMSLPAIGRQFSGRDHTTVLHACNKIEKEMQQDQRLRTTITDLTKRLMER